MIKCLLWKEEKPEDTPLPATSLVTTQFFPVRRGGVWVGYNFLPVQRKEKKHKEDELEQNLPKLVHPWDHLFITSPNCLFFNT